jgi:hypothetical protein
VTPRPRTALALSSSASTRAPQPQTQRGAAAARHGGASMLSYSRPLSAGPAPRSRSVNNESSYHNMSTASHKSVSFGASQFYSPPQTFRE